MELPIWIIVTLSIIGLPILLFILGSVILGIMLGIGLVWELIFGDGFSFYK